MSFRVPMGAHEIPIAVVLNQRNAGQLVFELLMLGHAKPGLAYGPFPVMSGPGVGGFGGRFGDGVGLTAIIALEHLSSPFGPLEHQIGLRLQRDRRMTDIDETTELRIHQALRRRRAPMTSRRALPIARSTRP